MHPSKILRFIVCIYCSQKYGWSLIVRMKPYSSLKRTSFSIKSDNIQFTTNIQTNLSIPIKRYVSRVMYDGTRYGVYYNNQYIYSLIPNYKISWMANSE